jgi:HEAT repeat protein
MERRSTTPCREERMVAFNVVGRFRHQNDLNAYRRKLASEVGHDFILRLLPALLDVPLPMVGADGGADTLDSAPRFTLAGSSGSGRRLALQQLAVRWANQPGQHHEASQPASLAPKLIALPMLDDGATPPEQLLASWAVTPGESHETRPSRDGRGIFRRNMELLAKPGQLLIYGWEELSAARRDAWRTALLDLARRDPYLRLIVTLPEDEPAWPAFVPLNMAAITPDVVAAWVEHLAPPEFRAPLLEVLAPGNTLHPLAARLFDVALLAWCIPLAGMPRNRGELYDRALASVLGMTVERLASNPTVASLQLLAAYDEPPARPTSEMVAAGADGALHFVHPHISSFLAARQLVAEGRYQLLRSVGQRERADLALMTAGLLEDPAPVFATLWNEGRLSASDLFTLARCLHERAPRAPAWTLRIIGALARVADPQEASQTVLREQARDLLSASMAALDAVLIDAVASDAGRSFLFDLLQRLPAELAAPRLLRLALSPVVPEPFGWAVADALLGRMELTEHATTPAEPATLARWIYLHALHEENEQREPLDATAARAGLAALAQSAAGELRQLRTTAALLDDPAQVTATRLAALELLARSSQPAALTVIERASDDADPAVRTAALTALNSYEPERAVVALGRAALDTGAPWELRLNAIERLNGHLARGAGRTLERCTADTSLPLFARMRAVQGLAAAPEGVPALIEVLDNQAAHSEVRAAAARALGASGHAEALPALLEQLDRARSKLSGSTDESALLAGCCDGLADLKSRSASSALLRLIDLSQHDVPLTLAALRALGQIGDPDTIEPISRLLGGEALYRLERGLDPRLIEHSAETCATDPALPQSIARELALTLASSTITEARPTTLLEFLSSEADRVRAATALALAAIGGNTARAALLAALIDGAGSSLGGAVADMLAALADVEGTESAGALGYLLDMPDQNPLTGWLIVRQLTEHSAGEEVMHRALTRTDIGPFTRGALAEGLGQRGTMAALPTLRALASEPAGDPHLRSQALLALGLLNDPGTETTLTRLIGDRSEDVLLRGQAAEHLPEQLSSEGRRFLRDLLRNERPAAPLAVGALKALGRARDREALPLMLRYSQDESPAVAQAAIAALTDLGDASMAPMLVRITQQPAADHALRLQAVGALLRIGGDGYRPLLRIYLTQGALPFRLLALEYLIEAGAPVEELLALLADASWPTPLRLRLLETVAAQEDAAPTLARILADEHDDAQIRALAANALGRLAWPDALPNLIQQATHEQAPLALRLRCISALRTIGGDLVGATLSRLAEDAAQPASVRYHAMEELRMIARNR